MLWIVCVLFCVALVLDPHFWAYPGPFYSTYIRTVADLKKIARQWQRLYCPGPIFHLPRGRDCDAPVEGRHCSCFPSIVTLLHHLPHPQAPPEGRHCSCFPSIVTSLHHLPHPQAPPEGEHRTRGPLFLR